MKSKFTRTRTEVEGITQDEVRSAFKRPLTYLVWYSISDDTIFDAIYLDRNHFFYHDEQRAGRMLLLGEL